MSVELVIGALAVWRVTSLLLREEGPWATLRVLREKVGLRLAPGLFSCWRCASLWTSAPVAWVLVERPRDRLLTWLALSAGAIIIDHFVSPPAAEYWEEPSTEATKGTPP